MEKIEEEQEPSTEDLLDDVRNDDSHEAILKIEQGETDALKQSEPDTVEKQDNSSRNE